MIIHRFRRLGLYFSLNGRGIKVLTADGRMLQCSTYIWVVMPNNSTSLLCLFPFLTLTKKQSMKWLIQQIAHWREWTHQQFLLVQLRPITSTIYTLRFPKAKSISINTEKSQGEIERHPSMTASDKATAELPSPTCATAGCCGSSPSLPSQGIRQVGCPKGSSAAHQSTGGLTTEVHVLKNSEVPVPGALLTVHTRQRSKVGHNPASKCERPPWNCRALVCDDVQWKQDSSNQQLLLSLSLFPLFFNQQCLWIPFQLAPQPTASSIKGKEPI